MHQSPNGKPAGMYPLHRPPGPVGLTRFGSAPGSLLTTLVDSVVGGETCGGGENEFSAAADNMIGRFFTGESPCLTSESSCKAGVSPDLAAYGKRKAPGGMGLGLQRSYGLNEMAVEDLEMGIGAGGLRTGSSSLIRHSSSPAGFLSHLMVDNGLSRGESYHHAGADNVHAMANRSLKSQLSFSSRQDSLSQISEVSIPDVGESVGGSNSSDEAAAGTVGQSFISSNFHLGSWDETNSIVFSATPGKRKDNNGDIIATLGGMDPSQFGLQKASLEMDKFLQIPQDSVPCKIRAKRGCATHPRSIAERVSDTFMKDSLPSYMHGHLITYACMHLLT
ncbi:hypothetical protein Taro_032606 [Colocasia esculenta]|uniref:Uncharacterized protein n=1 Tax=Colocasia esculenta TaxID=4460 RepID=A0A843VRR6_COLES|nr:hypothetical protein [Colocasia esculenta]